MQQHDVVNVKAVVRACLTVHKPVMIWGMPGCGKSEIVRQITREDDAVELEIRLSQYDSVDLRGIPFTSKAEGSGTLTTWAPPSTLPFVGNPNFKTDRPIYLFLDELPQALPAVQAVAFQLVLDRRIGEHYLMSNVEVIAAGNREGDKAGAHRMLSALSNRFIHIELIPVLEAWCKWAWEKNKDARVIAFLRLRPDLLCTFIDNKGIANTAKAFATPRSWETVCDVLTLSISDVTRFALVSGSIGDGPAAELEGFLRTWEKMPDIDHILKMPLVAPVPADAATLFAVSAALASRSKADNFANVVDYVKRMPPEYAARTILDACLRDENLMQSKAFVAFAATHVELFTGS